MKNPDLQLISLGFKFMSHACLIVSTIVSLIWLKNLKNSTDKVMHLIPLISFLASCRPKKTQLTFQETSVFWICPLGICYNLTSAGLDSTVMADMKLAVRDMETGRAVILRPPIRKSPEFRWPLSAQA